MILLCFSCHLFSGLISTLSTQAHARLPGALATSTNRAYQAMFRLYLAFLTFNATSTSQVTVNILLAFLEFLHFNSTTVSQIKNYLSAIKHFFHRFGLPSAVWDSPKITLYFTSLQKSTPFCVKIHNLIDIPLLKKLITACDATYMGRILKQYT